jgi:hypothetical protein
MVFQSNAAFVHGNMKTPLYRSYSYLAVLHQSDALAKQNSSIARAVRNTWNLSLFKLMTVDGDLRRS